MRSIIDGCCRRRCRGLLDESWLASRPSDLIAFLRRRRSERMSWACLETRVGGGAVDRKKTDADGAFTSRPT